MRKWPGTARGHSVHQEEAGGRYAANMLVRRETAMKQICSRGSLVGVGYKAILFMRKWLGTARRHSVHQEGAGGRYAAHLLVRRETAMKQICSRGGPAGVGYEAILFVRKVLGAGMQQICSWGWRQHHPTLHPPLPPPPHPPPPPRLTSHPPRPPFA